MAKLICVSWIPRSYVHLFETYNGIEKIALNVSDVKFDEDEISFKISGYGKYPEIFFTQGWSGLHYFVVDVPNENIDDRAIQFIRDMQLLLLNEIFKKCHTVTYRQISSDVIPLDFHVIVMSKERFSIKKNFVEKKVRDLTIAFDPKEIYSPGTLSYLFGSEDVNLKKVLLYHAYVEIAAAFLLSMNKRLTRLYHEAASAVEALESSDDLKAVTEAMKLSDTITKDSSESFGKLKQAEMNFEFQLQEYKGRHFTDFEAEIANALDVEESLRRINVDVKYMHIQWEDVLIEFLENVDSTLDAHLMIHGIQKNKKGLFW
ncbi:MAG: hypothetical protein V1703_00995 [Candidatus Altiarchaeota archaeon]